jgi:hypothetical protein
MFIPRPIPPPTGPLEIPVTHDRFPSAFAVTTTLRTNWAELAWAAITVGRWRNDLFLHGRYSRYEALSRSHAVYAYVTAASGTIRLARTALYDSLDASEKSGVSYLFGMTTVKLWADVFLGVPHVMHLDRYRTQYSVSTYGTHRPDLFAPIGAGDWLVIEAKGRTNGFTRSDLTAAVSQKNAVALISGRRPILSVASVAHFGNGNLELLCSDPPPEGQETLELDTTRFVRAYYDPLLALLGEEGGAVSSDDPLVPPSQLAYLSEMDLWVGLTEEALHRLGSDDDVIGLVPSLEEDAAPRQSREGIASEPDPRNSVAVGADGVVVVLGPAWADVPAAPVTAADR